MTCLASAPAFKPSAQQQVAIDAIKNWLQQNLEQRFRMGGYAGTGKTTLLAKSIIPYLQHMKVRFSVNTFTGIASTVLARKGITQAATIDNLIYISDSDETGAYRRRRRTAIDAQLIIIDEATMVSKTMQTDIEWFGVPVLYFGDRAQLPPVGEDNGLMEEPDFELTEIHRQAAKSPIIRLATAVRNGLVKLPKGSWGNDEIGYVSINSGRYDLLDYDIIICGKNATRHRLNAEIRRLLKRKKLLEIGDNIICLKNDQRSNLRNGSIVRVYDIQEIGHDEACVSVIDDNTNEYYEEIPILTSCFGNEPNKDEWQYTRALPFDYGNVVTNHKFQGSQALSVAYVDEFVYKISQKRMRYTGITRAEHRLHVALSS